MKIKFYGNRGWITQTDEHSCFSIYTKRTKILFDAGSPKILIPENINLDAIILSHVHLDHIKNLYNLLAYMNVNGRKKSLKIYAPINLKGKISEEIIPNADDFRKFSYEFITIPPTKIGDFKFDFFISTQKTKPVVKVYSIKIKTESKSITYITDVSLTNELIEFCKESEIIICDASSRLEQKFGHFSPESVSKIALTTNPKKIILTHFDELTPEEFSKKVNYKNTICATPLLELDI
ncbi:MBL fold metallo-hydrolase [Candidatus Woesearchaeota archaeon]|nr:MBL fold metallo-hydrolase [Candidatus Woesearchaeota archaeon]